MNINEILGNIGFDWRVALANLLNFLVIFYLLKRFAFGPIREALAGRRKKIEQGLEDARRAETSRMMAEQSFEKKMSEAKDQANEIVSAARREEESIVDKAREFGKRETKRLVHEAAQSISNERSRMEMEIKEKAADLVIAGVESILREKIDAKEQNKIIEKILVT